MILAVDVGNTYIVIGVIDGDNLVCSGRIATTAYDTEDDYAMRLHSFIHLNNLDDIDGAIVSSVVPVLSRTITKAIKLVCKVDAVVVGPGVKTGLNIRIDNPAELGADLVVGSVASIAKYPCPQVIFDFGTATTASVIDENKTYIGGVVLCGVKTAINAISNGAAQLPQVDISAPERVISSNTIDCMRSGAVYGTAAMMDGLVSRIECELGKKVTVIVTGELGKTISKECVTDIIYDDNLLIDGLRIIYNKNK
ncbi:MAG: type III pantothenate kinase [Acetobacter sp.]|nr:type III pantothenate kinase [Bacteroides sp.]MCM1341734.1 type III pantothenate kinase [Acetobacter sp.]MCM1432327.1 type III pantothenate kinase [Clostridiales bacterium]